jgi:hypothetical protein
MHAPCHWPACRDNTAGACTGPCTLRGLYTVPVIQRETVHLNVAMPRLGEIAVVVIDDSGNVAIHASEGRDVVPTYLQPSRRP